MVRESLRASVAEIIMRELANIDPSGQNIPRDQNHINGMVEDVVNNYVQFMQNPEQQPGIFIGFGFQIQEDAVEEEQDNNAGPQNLQFQVAQNVEPNPQEQAIQFNAPNNSHNSQNQMQEQAPQMNFSDSVFHTPVRNNNNVQYEFSFGSSSQQMVDPLGSNLINNVNTDQRGVMQRNVNNGHVQVMSNSQMS